MQVTNLCLELQKWYQYEYIQNHFPQCSEKKIFSQKIDTLSEVNFIVCLPLYLT